MVEVSRVDLSGLGMSRPIVLGFVAVICQRCANTTFRCLDVSARTVRDEDASEEARAVALWLLGASLPAPAAAYFAHGCRDPASSVLGATAKRVLRRLADMTPEALSVDLADGLTHPSAEVRLASVVALRGQPVLAQERLEELLGPMLMGEDSERLFREALLTVARVSPPDRLATVAKTVCRAPGRLIVDTAADFAAKNRVDTGLLLVAILRKMWTTDARDSHVLSLVESIQTVGSPSALMELVQLATWWETGTIARAVTAAAEEIAKRGPATEVDAQLIEGVKGEDSLSIGAARLLGCGGSVGAIEALNEVAAGGWLDWDLKRAARDAIAAIRERSGVREEPGALSLAEGDARAGALAVADDE